MFFTIISSTNNSELNKAQITLSALRLITFYKLSPSDKLLDRYCLKQYNINLKGACRLLLAKATIANSKNNEQIVYFKEKYYENMAKLITYGNEQINGCKLIKLMFHCY